MKKEDITKSPLAAVCGLLLGLTSLFGMPSPLPLVFLGVFSGLDSIYALTGSAVGFFISGRFYDSAGLLAVMAAIVAFKALTRRRKHADLFTAVLSGTGVFVTTLILSADSASAVTAAPALGVLTGFGARAVSLCRELILSGKNLALLRPTGFAALGLTYALTIAALMNFEVSMLNFGLVFASICTISFAYKFRSAGGAVCGSVGAFGVAITAPHYMSAALIICAAGAAGGLFARLGKYAQMAGFVLATGLFASFSGLDNFQFIEVNSVIAGGIFFLLVPADTLMKRFKRETVPKGGAEVAEIFAERLRLTGEAMGDVRCAIEKTAQILDRAGSKEISWVYNTACGEICRRCKFNMTCWGSEYDETVRIMEELTHLLRKGRTIKPEHFYGQLGYRCEKREQLATALNAQYREYTAINAANRKIAQMRTILLSQISATQTMMVKMSGEFASLSDFDRHLAAITEKVLADYGITEAKAAVNIADDRAEVEAYGKGRLTCDAERLCDLLSATLRREFDLPEITHAGGEFRLTMFERAAFSLEYGVYQVSRGKEKNCGDYFDSFVDKKGFAYIILSDGMGSGGRARIDSAFACGMLVKLLRAGVDMGAAIEIINNSLLVKSADESFATLDVCRIDLYSGNVELFKAGSAPTYISCNKRVVKASGKGLPVGINHRPVYERQSFTIGVSDLIIMASDGAELSEKWLESELGKNEWGKEDMNAFAETIATSAKFSAGKEREDDISVIAVKLVK